MKELEIPNIGFGTASTVQESYGQAGTAVKVAIDLGYRYFDTSRLYFNESEIGLAIAEKIRENVITRDDIRVANKIWCTYDDCAVIEKLCRESLDKLRRADFHFGCWVLRFEEKIYYIA